MAPRVRFAPSPTGYLHIGGARTALFNWLFARRRGGIFVLRIEDTDLNRSTNEMVDGILDGLRWLGLDWDEGPLIGGEFGPYFQSQRFDRHRAMADRLVETGRAYYCYCTQESLQARREEGERAGGAWMYDRTCASLSPDEVAAREGTGMPRAIRFKVPQGVIRFADIVHGPIEFDGAHLEDFIIVRSDGTPTYNLSVVSDDVEMKISHVVRGDDHISNTPKQILLYQAAGADVPLFAHVPLIMGPDKKRLSKRHGATSVMEYAERGYVPEAMVNFLALLGWSPGSDEELFAKSELAERFDLGGISGGNAVFNPEKLDWFNQQHLLTLAPDELARRLQPAFERAGLWDPAFLDNKHAWFFAVLELLKPRARTLAEFIEVGRFFFSESLEYDQTAVTKLLKTPGATDLLQGASTALAGLPEFEPAAIEAAVRATADTKGVKAATLIHTLRVAVTGRTASPGLFEVIALVGRGRTAARIETAIAMANGPGR